MNRSEGLIFSCAKSQARKQMLKKKMNRKTKQLHEYYLPKILQERMQSADLCQTVHASRQSCREICRQFVEYQLTTTSSHHSNRLQVLVVKCSGC